MQFIKTKWIGPSPTKRARVVATASGHPRRVVMSVHSGAGGSDPHENAMRELCRLLEWDGYYTYAEDKDGSRVWVALNQFSPLMYVPSARPLPATIRKTLAP